MEPVTAGSSSHSSPAKPVRAFREILTALLSAVACTSHLVAPAHHLDFLESTTQSLDRTQVYAKERPISAR